MAPPLVYCGTDHPRFGEFDVSLADGIMSGAPVSDRTDERGHGCMPEVLIGMA